MAETNGTFQVLGSQTYVAAINAAVSVAVSDLGGQRATASSSLAVTVVERTAAGRPLGLPTVTATFRIPRRRPGAYVLELSSAGLVDLQGRHLTEGTYVGSSGNYLAEFVTNGRTPAGPQVVGSLRLPRRHR